MNCPYCNKPMEEGRLYGPGAAGYLFWLPEGEKVHPAMTLTAIEKKNGLAFASDPQHFYPYLQTHVCRSCSYGIFPFSEEE